MAAFRTAHFGSRGFDQTVIHLETCFTSLAHHDHGWTPSVKVFGAGKQFQLSNRRRQIGRL